MPNLDFFLTEPLAFYAAGLATADWLTGKEPGAIYRWDQTGCLGQTAVNRCKRLVRLETNFKPVSLPARPTKSEVKRARAAVLNKAAVMLSGIAGMQSVERFPKQGVRTIFDLVVSDLNRAGALLEPVSKSADMGTYLAMRILEDTMKFFQKPKVKGAVEDLAVSILQSGSLHCQDDWAKGVLQCAEEERVCFPETLIEWPKHKGNYVMHSGQAKRDSAPHSGETGASL